MKYGLEQPPVFSELFASWVKSPQADHDGRIFVGSGKAGIELILAHLRKTGILKNKMSRVVVPEWLGTWVYAQVLNNAFPVGASEAHSASAVLCYHQYGFPQNMERVLDIASDRGMTVIEDCAHAAAGSYKGRPLGSWGDYALYSYSKFTFCYALGAVAASDAGDFAAFVADRLKHGPGSAGWLINGFKFLDERNASKPSQGAAFGSVRKMVYARYGDQIAASPGAIGLWKRKREAEFAARGENYQTLRQALGYSGICDHLEDEDVVPYAVPLAVKPDSISEIASRLNLAGIAAGSYQFDFARCVFEPDFRPVLLVPIHSGMRGRGMDVMMSTLRDAL